MPVGPPSTESSKKFVAMTSSDKIIASSRNAQDGGRSYKSSQTTQNLNSSVHNTNNLNNNISQNTADYNDSNESGDQHQRNIANVGLSPHLNHSTAIDHRAMSSKSPSNASHFAAGSGILADTPPARPTRKQYTQKSK